MAKAKPKAKSKKPSQTLIQRSRSVSAAAKAMFQQGPGSKRVYRPFFGLSDSEIDQLSEFIGVRVQVNLESGS